jgi:L-asparaginase II
VSAVVEVYRGGMVESRHRVSVAVVDGEGRLRARAGDPGLLVFARSAMKPFQALPLVQDGVVDRFGLTPRELALCCASHSAEERHVEGVRSILRRIGADEEALACGPHPPMNQAAAEALALRGEAPGRIHNNCSGKHAGMLALARAHGWSPVGYHRPEHPVQQRVAREVSAWTGVPADEIPVGVDGCGVPTFAVPLTRLAGAYGRLASAVRRGDPAPGRVVGAMLGYPEYVAGTGRLCTALMRAASGRIFAKTGAEGVYCTGVPGAELGLALKVEDGASRASEPALVAVLEALRLLAGDELAALESYAAPDVRNTRGEAVGFLRARVTLEPADA